MKRDICIGALAVISCHVGESFLLYSVSRKREKGEERGINSHGLERERGREEE